MVRLAQAVFKGGGVKGIGLVGGLAVAEERGWRWRATAGTSAGSIIAALVAAGYRAAEIRQIFLDLDFRKFKDREPSLANLLRREGIYKGRYMHELIERLLTEKLGKAVVTFRDLLLPCRVVASDLTYRRMLVLPDDLAGPPYRLADPYAFPVADAVRASSALPFFFEPYHLTLPDERRVTLVDGGLLSNFPVHLFEPVGRPAILPTFGFAPHAPRDLEPQPTESPLELFAAMVNTILGGRDRADVGHQSYARQILIDTSPYQTTQFHLDEEGKEWLYQSGREAAEHFFADPATQEWLRSFSYRMAAQSRPAPVLGKGTKGI